MSENDKRILDQSVSDAELEQITGGEQTETPLIKALDPDPNNCTRVWHRDIRDGGFPNCAATVEEGSWCKRNDACYSNAVGYRNMNDCIKAYQ